jgi:SNF2 family DNA or RNA helicase
MDKGVEVCGITGKVKGAARQDVVNRFNAPGGPRVMFLNTKAGGVGITLDSADDMVFLDETDRPDDQTQAEGRINNRRPEEKVAQRRYWYLKSRGSVDEGIAAVNYALDLGQMAMLDGRRGVNFAKAVVEYLEGN